MNLPKLETNSDKIRKSIINEFLKQKLISKIEHNEITLGDIINEKLIGFVFDASWCSPGKSFCNDLLIPIYNQSLKENLQFEIVYVSFDTDDKQVRDSLMSEHANWLLWPMEKTITKKLIDFLNVKYLPSLVTITSNFQIISSLGRRDLIENGLESVINWSYFWRQAKNIH